MKPQDLPAGWPRGLPLPQGWSAPLLSDVAHRESGHTPDKKRAAYWDGDIKWLSLTDCDRLNRVYIHDTDRRITQAGIDNSSARLLPAGVVVLSRDAGVGQSAITTCPMAVSQHFLAWQCSEQLDAHFLYYWMQRLRPELERIAAGSTIKTIGLRYFDKLRVPLPPLHVQRSAASTFLSLDQIADLLDHLRETKLIFKHALRQQLLSGQRRFPEFGGRPWVERPLREFFREMSVANLDRSADLIYSCTKTVGIVPQSERFGKRLASADLKRYKVVDYGDLVYDPMLLWDGSIGFVPESGRGVVSPAYETFTPNDNVNRTYFAELLKSYNLLHRYKQISQGTNTRRRKAHASDFLKIVVRVPPTREEQDRIADVLALAQREIELIRAQQEQFTRQKQALMEQLLSGAVAVST